MQGLQHPPSQKAKGTGRPLTLKSYKIDNCSASAGEKATFVVRQLNVSPDPVVLPGTLTFQFDINVLTDLSDLQVQLLEGFKNLFTATSHFHSNSEFSTK